MKNRKTAGCLILFLCVCFMLPGLGIAASQESVPPFTKEQTETLPLPSPTEYPDDPLGFVGYADRSI